MDYDRSSGGRAWNEPGYGRSSGEGRWTYGDRGRSEGNWNAGDRSSGQGRWAGDRWSYGDRWRTEPGMGYGDTWRGDMGPGTMDRSGGSRGFYEDDRGRVHQFTHEPERYSGGEYPGSTYAGNYSGRGPKGYRRGDDRIREDVCDRLTADWHVDATEVEVIVANGEVTLQGAVHSREEKRKAEDVAEMIPGVREVHNNLRVSRWDENRNYGSPETPSGTNTSMTSAGPNTGNTRR
jgi:hypothetical protein